MSQSTPRASGRVVSLREEFDRAFALPRKPPAPAGTRLLAIEVRGDPYALRTSELAGLTSRRKLVQLPGGVPEQTGLVGVRGKLLIVYSLGSLLGYGGARRPEPWIVQCGPEPSVGLSFEALDGPLEAAPGSLVPLGRREGSSKHLNEVLEEGPVARPLISVVSVLTAIQGLVRHGKEP